MGRFSSARVTGKFGLVDLCQHGEHYIISIFSYFTLCLFSFFTISTCNQIISLAQTIGLFIITISKTFIADEKFDLEYYHIVSQDLKCPKKRDKWNNYFSDWIERVAKWFLELAIWSRPMIYFVHDIFTLWEAHEVDSDFPMWQLAFKCMSIEEGKALPLHKGSKPKLKGRQPKKKPKRSFPNVRL